MFKIFRNELDGTLIEVAQAFDETARELYLESSGLNIVTLRDSEVCPVCGWMRCLCGLGETDELLEELPDISEWDGE